MSMMDEDYKEKEHRLKKLYITFLLADLIQLNYCYSNKEYNNILGEDIWNSAIKKEKEEIISNVTSLLEMRYQLKLVNFTENIVKCILK